MKRETVRSIIITVAFVITVVVLIAYLVWYASFCNVPAKPFICMLR